VADISYSRIPAAASERWALVRDICSGGDTEALAKYLPELNRLDTSPQNAERNRAYKARAVLYNATGRTRDGLLGLAFRRDPTGLDKLPSRLAYLADDCDGAGISLYQQSQATLKRVLETGRHGLFIDYSEAISGPIIKAYRAEDIINWRTSLVGGKTVLTMVVLAEEAEIEDGYETKCVPQWRELLLTDSGVVVRVWQKASDGDEMMQIGEDIILRSVGAPLDELPFVFVGAQNNDSSIDEAPLFDLAYINRAHYRNSADYEDSVFLAGQPQPWMAGLDEAWRDHLEKQGTAYLGSRAMLMLPQGGAFGIAQAQPNTLAKEAMDQKEAQMIALGARLIEASQANRTATESDNDKEASTSVLSMCCANVSEAYTTAIALCARYLDLTMAADEGQYAVNQDFVRLQPEPQIITALVGAWQSGAFAKPDLRAFLRRLNVIEAERTDEEIEADLEMQGPALGEEGEDGEPMLNGPAQPGAQAVIEPPAEPLDLSPVVAAIRELKTEPAAPIDLPALVQMIVAAMPKPSAAAQPVDMAPIAEALRTGMEGTSSAIGALGVALASIQQQPTTINAPIEVAAAAPVDLTPIAEAMRATGEAMAAAVAGIKAPNVTLVQPKPNSAVIREADGSETTVTLN
jgi:Domain of unknown function (DUF4055)